MSITNLFKSLGAPLANHRRSWGSVRADDGVVFLRVWQNETHSHEGKRFMRLTDNEFFQNNDPQNSGYIERLDHVRLVEGGATSFMVMCEPRDEKAVPREIKDFNRRELFPGGQVIEVEGEKWLEMKARVPVEKIRL